MGDCSERIEPAARARDQAPRLPDEIEPVRRPSDIEEITNALFIHPISSRVALLLRDLHVSANAASILGMMFGLTAGIAYFHYRDWRSAAAGFALMIAWHIMDGARRTAGTPHPFAIRAGPGAGRHLRLRHVRRRLHRPCAKTKRAIRQFRMAPRHCRRHLPCHPGRRVRSAASGIRVLGMRPRVEEHTEAGSRKSVTREAAMAPVRLDLPKGPIRSHRRNARIPRSSGAPPDRPRRGTVATPLSGNLRPLGSPLVADVSQLPHDRHFPCAPSSRSRSPTSSSRSSASASSWPC